MITLWELFGKSSAIVGMYGGIITYFLAMAMPVYMSYILLAGLIRYVLRIPYYRRQGDHAVVAQSLVFALADIIGIAMRGL